MLEVRVHKADTKSNKSGERTSFCTMPVSTHGWETESPMRTGDVDAATALSSSHPPNMFCLWPSLATVLTELLAPHENTRRNTSKKISKITRFFLMRDYFAIFQPPSLSTFSNVQNLGDGGAK